MTADTPLGLFRGGASWGTLTATREVCMHLRLRLVLAGVALLATLGCSGPVTKLTNVWSNPDVKGPVRFNKVLVAVLARNPQVRKAAEGHLTVLMKNTIGIPSYMAVSDATARDRAKMEEMLKREGIDGAIVMRVVSATETVEWVPTSYPGFMGYYSYCYPMAMTSGYLHEEKNVRVETKIFSLKDDTVVYGAYTNTLDTFDPETVLVQVAEALGADLKARGLIQ